MFTLTMETEGTAFRPYPEGEVSVILRQVINQVGNGTHSGTCRDSNGNKVGSWELTEDRGN